MLQYLYAESGFALFYVEAVLILPQYDKHTGQMDKRSEHIDLPFVPDQQAAEIAQPGECPLYAPAAFVSSQCPPVLVYIPKLRMATQVGFITEYDLASDEIYERLFTPQIAVICARPTIRWTACGNTSAARCPKPPSPASSACPTPSCCPTQPTDTILGQQT